MKNFNPLDGDRAAIEYDNQVERNASEKRWDAFYKGCQDKRNHRPFNAIFTTEDEVKMYELGYKSVKKD